MAVWMRGMLRDGYRLDSSNVQWFTLSGSSNDTQSLNIPDEFSEERIQAWEELDGYPHKLDRRETFLLSLLDRGALDAVVSFQARIDCERSRPLLPENSLWSHPLNSQIYPINHLFVVHTDIVHEFPTIAESLLLAFTEARGLWTNYQPLDERKAFESEITKLGYDPFAYRLSEVEKATLEALVGYLQRETLISRKPGLDELFYGGI